MADALPKGLTLQDWISIEALGEFDEKLKPLTQGEATKFANHWGSATASLLIRAMYSPREARMPAFTPPENPIFESSSSRRYSPDGWLRNHSLEPSVEPLSTTNSSLRG